MPAAWSPPQATSITASRPSFDPSPERTPTAGEEKARGLTIDLGFAHTVLDSGTELSFVDVPGHVRFLPNMLAGVGGVAACLFVVAATEGWKPQSEEHLRILELAGTPAGVVALTKVDGLGREEVDFARLALEDALAGSFLANAPVVEVSAPPAAGLPNCEPCSTRCSRASMRPPMSIVHGSGWIAPSALPARERSLPGP